MRPELATKHSARRAVDTHALRAPELHPAERVDRIDDSLADEFAPCRYWLREGRTYGVRCDGALALDVGAERLEPAWPGLFSWNVRNAVGRATIRAVNERRRASPPLDVEVVAKRFDGPNEQLRFVRAMVDAIEREQIADPFRDRHLSWRASLLDEGARPPPPRVLIDRLARDGAALAGALDAIVAQPAREAHTRATRVRLATDASDVELCDMVSADGAWEDNARGVATQKLRGRAPREAWGSTLEWTADCAENRLLRARLATLVEACSSRSFDRALRASTTIQRTTASSALERVKTALVHEPFASAKAAATDPERARNACERRDAYRDALHWIDRALSRSTLRWPTVEHAASLRDAATLYELYCFFALARAIAATIGTAVQFHKAPSSSAALARGSSAALARGASATFGDAWTLVYNRDIAAYSGTLRPDFALLHGEKVELVFDAKMRVRDGHEREGDDAARVDLDKMHAYRDALGVRAAVCLFPGDRSMLYRTDGTRAPDVKLASLVRARSAGIAALALCPEHAL